ncbi:hypothetical protein [Streptomyces sp. ALB3]|uniref:hypothetical protein n=1 Tax=Streptomyces sp. ALB3 TaxID=3374278 RepID=UPI0037A403C0
MTLLELIARADERGLATSGVACLDRLLPPPEGGGDQEPLRPLWPACESGTQWAARIDAVHTALEAVAKSDATAARVRTLLGAAPRHFDAGPLRAWADACSLLALDVHREFDVPAGSGAEAPGCGRDGGAVDAGPLAAGELRRQVRILEDLAGTTGTTGTTGTAGGGAGLRGILDLSAEGRRVLRAVMSRRARGRGLPLK